MKESEDRKYSQVKFAAIVITVSVCLSIITSYFVAKTPTPISLTPTVTSNFQTSTPVLSPTPYVLPSVTPIPRELQTPQFLSHSPEIEANLIQNGEFENGLSGWLYTDIADPTKKGQSTGITVFETDGVNGKAFCSRRFAFWNQPNSFKNEWVGFAQDIPIDPTQSYFFSAWVKLYEANSVMAMAKFYYGESEQFTDLLNRIANKETTTNGWFYIQSYKGDGLPKHAVPDGVPTANRVVIGFWHLAIDIPIETTVSSTFCVDNVVFGKIVK